MAVYISIVYKCRYCGAMIKRTPSEGKPLPGICDLKWQDYGQIASHSWAVHSKSE